MRRICPVLLATSLLLVGAACGGDDGGGGERLSAEAFRSQANAICAEGNTRIEQAEEEAFSEADPNAFPSEEEIESFVKDSIIPSVEQQIEELRDLNPPEDLEGDFEQMLDDAESALDDVREMSAEEIVQTEDDPFEDVNRQARELGLDACGEE